MSGIRVGDRVRTPQGRTDWTVTRLGVSNGLHVAWMRADNGRQQRYRTDRLICVQAGDLSTAETPKYDECKDGAILIDGKVIRASDSTAEVVMEWQRPTVRDIDPTVPSVVTLATWRDRESPDGFVWIIASSDENTEGAQLTRHSALELAAHLTTIAARMK